MGKPSDCWSCEQRFMGDYALQAKVLHIVRKLGDNMAEAELNEKYEEWHEGGHEGEYDGN